MKKSKSKFYPRQTMLSRNFEIYHYFERYFKPLDFHNHDFYEFYLFLAGEVTYYIEDEIYSLRPGDLLIIPPGKMHRPVLPDERAVYDRIVLWARPDFMATFKDGDVSVLKKIETLQGGAMTFHLGDEDIGEAIYCTDKLIDATNSEEFGASLLKNAYVSVLLTLFTKAAFSFKRHEDAEAPKNDIIPRVIRYINENLNSDLSLESLSEKFFISKYHLLREFKKYTNATVYDYIIAKRIILAKDCIRKGISASDACQICGFFDYSNFYKAFIKKTGLTPKQFKNTCEEYAEKDVHR